MNANCCSSKFFFFQSETEKREKERKREYIIYLFVYYFNKFSFVLCESYFTIQCNTWDVVYFDGSITLRVVSIIFFQHIL